MRRWVIRAIAFAGLGCVSDYEFAKSWEGGPHHGAPPSMLEIRLPLALMPGVTSTVFVEGGQPGDEIWLIAGTQDGAGPCPPNWGGSCLGIVKALNS